MNKVWLVFKHEYLRHVGRKRFIMAVLSLPLMILVIIGVAVIAAVANMDTRPVGYFDFSGVFASAQPVTLEKKQIFKPIEIRRFESEDRVIQAVETGEIQGAFILEADYFETGEVRLVANKPLNGDAFSQFSLFLRTNLLRTKPAALSTRLLKGPELTFRSLEDDREFNQNNYLAFIIPVVSGILLVFAINMSGGYLLQAVTEEKENRTIEMIVTSVSPNQLMAGKIFGNLSAGLTQIVIWALAGVGGVALVMRAFPELSGFDLDFTFLGLMLVTFFPAFIMVSSLMAMVGAIAAEARDAQQISAIFSLPVAVPLWFISVIMQKPNSPLAVGLSIFPFTAPVTLPMRGALTTLPWWQVAVSVILLILCAIAALWLASRAFRLGMLRYGKKLTMRELLRREVKVTQ